jgi:hypothetical protein
MIMRPTVMRSRPAAIRLALVMRSIMPALSSDAAGSQLSSRAADDVALDRCSDDG